MAQEDDERIRKALITFFNRFPYDSIEAAGTNAKEAIAWLEKQKAIDVLDEEEREFADNVDSYRKEIDAAYQKGYNEGVKATLEKQEDANKEYWRGYIEGKKEIFDKYAELEKQGEQKSTDEIKPKFKVGDVIRHKEQGFTCKITAVDTEYRVSDCCGSHLPFDLQDYYELVEQKPSWSEEDEKILKDIITDVKFEGYNNDMQANSYKKINWLKSLRLQNRWKPSEEQMEALLYASSVLSDYDSTLIGLYNDLKKLKG